MRYFSNAAAALIVVDNNTAEFADAPVYRYTRRSGWLAADDVTVVALTGPGWWPVDASEAVALQRAIGGMPRPGVSANLRANFAGGCG